MSTRRAMAALPWILALAVILVTLGLTGSSQVSSTRRTLEGIYARRVMDLAMQSALEEVSSQIERQLGPVPYPVIGQRQREGLSQLGKITSCTLKTTPATYGPEGIKVEQVALVWSPFKVTTIPLKGRLLACEFGVVTMESHLVMQLSHRSLKRKFTARRYISLQPDQASGQLRFRVSAYSPSLVVTHE